MSNICFAAACTASLFHILQGLFERGDDLYNLAISVLLEELELSLGSVA